MAYIKSKNKEQKENAENELFKLKIQRINTFLIMKSFGCDINSPEALYKLEGDEEIKVIDLKSEEMDNLFNEKFV